MTALLLAHSQNRVQRAIDGWLPSNDAEPVALHQAMRYAVLAKGKRLRPALVYATGHVFNLDDAKLDGPACAVELIHAYSLVHDDLPAMDDDALRRGQPTCHIKFGEAAAILAGDALQSLAFRVLCEDPNMACLAEQRCRMIKTLADATGSRGMAGGQAMDLEAEGKTLPVAVLESIHMRKTGRLITASVLLGALSAPQIKPDQLQALQAFGEKIGFAFQIQDDILDIEGDTASLGKTQGADLARHKLTYPALLGLDSARKKTQELHREALRSLQGLGEDAEPLQQLSEFIISRKH